MPGRPAVVAFDVVETLFSLEPVGRRLESAGLPDALEAWFARLLRDGMALSLAGSFAPFSQVAVASLEVVMAQRGVEPTSERVEAVMAGFKELPLQADARPALEALDSAGERVIALTNGGADATKALLGRAGVHQLFEQVVSIDEVRSWKPEPQPYLHAAALCRVAPGQMALVSVHAWDIHGARTAGLATGWASRLERRWPASMKRPDVAGDSLPEVVVGLLALPAAPAARTSGVLAPGRPPPPNLAP
jgi:2-haloacid dehalogenase